MNSKEVKEIRRRLRPEKNNIQQIHGCYVNSQKEIISTFDESVALLTNEERETYIALLKKSLSGSLGKNLVDISFATKQVMDSDEHRLLSALRKTGLKDEEVLNTFYRVVIDALNMEDENYLILIAHDVYDVPHFRKDGSQDEDYGDTFSYIICSICPVKTGKPVLGYSNVDSSFRQRSMAQVVGKTGLGFMFPAFDDRTTNIYNALFYSKNPADIHEEFIDAVFKTEIPMSAGEQKDAFDAAVSSTFENKCSFGLMQAMNDEMSRIIEQYKETKDPEPLRITIDEAAELMERSGMPAENRETFVENCKERFGENADLRPENLVDSRRFDIVSGGVKIKVNPESRNLIKTKIINGRKYILIPADGEVEINGIPVTVTEED